MERIYTLADGRTFTIPDRTTPIVETEPAETDFTQTLNEIQPSVFRGGFNQSPIIDEINRRYEDIKQQAKRLLKEKKINKVRIVSF